VCGRYTSITEDEIIQVRSILRDISFKLVRDDFLHSNASSNAHGIQSIHNTSANTPTPPEIAPTNRAPVITSNGNEIAFESARFGFTKWDGNGVIINARAETVHEKAMFRKHITIGRCVVPASSYFEWKQPDGFDRSNVPSDGEQTGKNKKKPKKIKHMIKDKDGNLLFMAGLWREGNNGREFVIITKDPFGDVVDIHDRMPVMLRTDQLEDWLSGAMAVEELMLLDYECVGEPWNQRTSEPAEPTTAHARNAAGSAEDDQLSLEDLL